MIWQYISLNLLFSFNRTEPKHTIPYIGELVFGRLLSKATYFPPGATSPVSLTEDFTADQVHNHRSIVPGHSYRLHCLSADLFNRVLLIVSQ